MQSSYHQRFLSLEGEKHLSCLSFENRATPKTIRAGNREMCAENSQGVKTLGPRRFSFPFLASKNKGIPEKTRAGPHPKPTLLLLLPPPRSHTCTHTPWQCAHSYPVELMVYVCVWRVCYLAQIHNSQPCLSLLLLTIARQQSAATHIEYCATASRCLGQPGHPHLSSLSTPTPPNIYDSDMKRVIYSRGSLTMSTRATRFPLESCQRRLQDGCEGNMMMCNKCIISCSLFREFGVMDSRYDASRRTRALKSFLYFPSIRFMTL